MTGVATLVAALVLGDWALSREVDPITDRVVASAVLVGEAGALRVECDAASPRGWMIIWRSGEFLGDGNSSRQRPAVYRLDGDPPVETRWTYIDDWATIREGRDRLAKGLRTAKRATFRGTTYRGGEVTLTFDLGEVAGAIDQTLAACGIDPPR